MAPIPIPGGRLIPLTARMLGVDAASTVVGELAVTGNVARATVSSIGTEVEGSFSLKALNKLKEIARSQNANVLVLDAKAIVEPRIVSILLKRYGGVLMSQRDVGGRTVSEVTAVLKLK